MRSMARRRPLGGLMGVSPFGLSSSPLADINYEFNRMLPLVDSMMNGASSSTSHVDIFPVYVKDEPSSPRKNASESNSVSLSLLEKLTVSRSPARSPPPNLSLIHISEPTRPY